MNRFPSRRPKVADAKFWACIFTDSVDRTWKLDQIQSVMVQRGEPFPDFYRVSHKNHYTGKTTSKLFYGESAHFEVQRYVSDLGFVSAYAMNL
jgi:hypothetical protein